MKQRTEKPHHFRLKLMYHTVECSSTNHDCKSLFHTLILQVLKITEAKVLFRDVRTVSTLNTSFEANKVQAKD